MRTDWFHRPRLLLFHCLLALVMNVSSACAGEELDKPMYRMPEPVPQIVHLDFQEGLVDIWLKALREDQQELKRNAADALTRSHALGYVQAQQAAEELLAQYPNKDHTANVHVALARALAELDVRAAQPLFEAELGTESAALAAAIEPSLARWKSETAINAWRQWLEDPTLDKTVTKRAIAGLVASGDPQCLGRLKEIVADDRRAFTIRQDAARALATLTSTDLEEFVRPWVNSDTPRLVRLLAATAIATHDSPSAIELMLEQGRDQEPTVALIACRRLAEIDLELLYNDLMNLSNNREFGLREIAVQGLAHRASTDDTRRLLEMLDDHHPTIRHNARVSLEVLADQESLRPMILQTAAEYLANLRDADDWRILEQAAVLVGNLDHEPTANSLLELLRFGREEVAVAAAWGLSRISLAETFPSLVDYGNEIADDVDASERSIGRLHSMQLTHLFQCLGLANYRPAKDMLARFVPKRNFKLGMECRAAAIWALGFIMEGDIDAELAQAITARMLDGASSPAEVLVVRRMSAVALGRMKAEVHLPELRQTVREGGLAMPLGWCAAWAVWQIADEPVPAVPDRTVYVQGWFLSPLPPPAGESGE